MSLDAKEMLEETKKKGSIPFLYKLVVGAAAGFVGTCCIYPIDMVW